MPLWNAKDSPQNHKIKPYVFGAFLDGPRQFLVRFWMGQDKTKAKIETKIEAMHALTLPL